MEEANLASIVGEILVPDRVDIEQLVQLSSVVLTTNFLESLEVGPTLFLNSYFVILDMSGLLLKKKPLVNNRDHVYIFRKDVGEFLEFCMKSFEVDFWSCCNQRNLKAIFQALKNVCSRNCMKQVQRCRMFDQDWCNICNLDRALISEGPYFFVKPLDTLF